jgi:glycogen operon protein
LNPSEYEYNYLMDGEVVVDPYARAVIGRDIWDDTQSQPANGQMKRTSQSQPVNGQVERASQSQPVNGHEMQGNCALSQAQNPHGVYGDHALNQAQNPHVVYGDHALNQAQNPHVVYGDHALSQAQNPHVVYGDHALNQAQNPHVVYGDHALNQAQNPHEMRGVLYQKEYDWEKDEPLEIPYHQIVAYSLHIRGLTMHPSAKVKAKGTFAGVVEKLPYLVDLGINQIHCMPVYDFEERLRFWKKNYWGYGPGYFFAPKASYAVSQDAVTELKDMVKSCHKAGVEVVLEMPFADDTPKQMIEECLRYYRMEYHIDGFILNPSVAPMDGIYTDPILKKTKIMVHNLSFQTVMRRFLKGDEGMVGEVIYWLRRNSKAEGSYNYIANHNGFTLCDLVSYNKKHNEENGEHNHDGPEYNYSWNYGVEGETRKRKVMALRKKQMKNALALVFLAQGTPCILAGDEFANTQYGNNNVYCQDNPTGWVDWKRLERNQELHDYVKALIAFRKQYPVFYPEQEYQGKDQAGCGIPDVSYHGDSAWRTPIEADSRMLGVYYSCRNGKKIASDRSIELDGEDCFVAYNMHEEEKEFALPTLPGENAWYRVMSTEESVLESPIPQENQRILNVEGRTIVVLTAKKAESTEKKEEAAKTESVAKV